MLQPRPDLNEISKHTDRACHVVSCLKLASVSSDGIELKVPDAIADAAAAAAYYSGQDVDTDGFPAYSGRDYSAGVDEDPTDNGNSASHNLAASLSSRVVNNTSSDDERDDEGTADEPSSVATPALNSGAGCTAAAAVGAPKNDGTSSAFGRGTGLSKHGLNKAPLGSLPSITETGSVYRSSGKSKVYNTYGYSSLADTGAGKDSGSEKESDSDDDWRDGGVKEVRTDVAVV